MDSFVHRPRDSRRSMSSAPSWPRAQSMRLHRTAIWRSASRRLTCATRTTSSSCCRTIPRCCTLARDGFSSGCRRTSISRRRCTIACRRSITWICVSKSACTCVRQRRERGKDLPPDQPPPRLRRKAEATGTRNKARRPTAELVASAFRRKKGNLTLARKERYLVGLDVGTSKIAAIVGEMTDDGGLDIIGLGLAESKGIRRGVVVNLEAAVESIKKAIEEAELTAGVEIDSVHLGLSGAHVKAFNSRGVVAVAGKNREITREDVRRAIDAAKAVALPSGREILHVLPQDFVVDEQDGIGRSEERRV